LQSLAEGHDFRERLSQEGARLVRSFTWDDQIDRVLRFMNGGDAAR